VTAIGAIPTRTTLIDTIPRSVVRDVVAVVGFALLTAGAAQVSFSLGFTPVPISGQTFAVLLAGGALGSQLGAASQLLYVAMGAIGLPFYTDAQGGWEVATGSTAGYLVGFIVAAYAVGWLAERGQDRQLATSITAFVAGSVIIYVLGVAWLAYDLNVPITAEFGEPSAIAYGVTPFVVGDILKAVLAGALLPAAWRLTKR
jgi:biotin transport system substrate-specific component